MKKLYALLLTSFLLTGCSFIFPKGKSSSSSKEVSSSSSESSSIAPSSEETSDTSIESSEEITSESSSEESSESSSWSQSIPVSSVEFDFTNTGISAGSNLEHESVHTALMNHLNSKYPGVVTGFDATNCYIQPQGEGVRDNNTLQVGTAKYGGSITFDFDIFYIQSYDIYCEAYSKVYNSGPDYSGVNVDTDAVMVIDGEEYNFSFDDKGMPLEMVVKIPKEDNELSISNNGDHQRFYINKIVVNFLMVY